MKTTFLHLSDLHYRPDVPEAVGVLCDALAQDLKSQVRGYENLHLVFSGDLVLRGGERDHFDAAMKVLLPVFDSIGLGQDRRFWVPGNHDISRPAVQARLPILEAVLDKLADETAFNDQLKFLTDTLLSNAFANYTSIEPSLAQYGCCKTHLGGAGWELSSELGIYCLNTALCSTAGLSDGREKADADLNRLMVDTRSLHEWLHSCRSTTRVLVMHHPTEWLAPWAKREVEAIVNQSFSLVLCGHVHQGTVKLVSRGQRGTVHAVAPPLFTNKSNLELGYSFVTIDTAAKQIAIDYRQWTPSRTFVLGTSLAGNDSGRVLLGFGATCTQVDSVPLPVPVSVDTTSILRQEFSRCLTSFSGKASVWVDRQLCSVSEAATARAAQVLFSADTLVDRFRPCLVRAPIEYGLSSLGRYIAWKHSDKQLPGTIVMLSASDVEPHRQGVIRAVQGRCEALGITPTDIAGLILDDYTAEPRHSKIIQNLASEFGTIPLMVLRGVDDSQRIVSGLEVNEREPTEIVYLWALDRNSVRELVTKYLHGHPALDERLVTAKIISDIDALNMHRTPLNVLSLLRLLEQSFDDSPVNRTEMIGRVFTILFWQFDAIPRYAIRPDLKDCEYALGYLCEWLFRFERRSFSRAEFTEKIGEYCDNRLISLDVEVLFAFLVSANVLVQRGTAFEFRFRYWFYYFAAHRMHHEPGFAEWVLADVRYAAYPELIEFYAGIDRRRSDVVKCLTNDLEKMTEEFVHRTGIAANFNPYHDAEWRPTDESLKRLREEVEGSMAESSLPASVKDAVMDRTYDRSAPYHQDLAAFVRSASLGQMIGAAQAASRALRNSDHVEPELKMKLLEQVLCAWERNLQISVFLSPILSLEMTAVFEGVRFVLDPAFGEVAEEARWQQVMTALPNAVINVFGDGLSSKKMGLLFARFIENHHDDVRGFLMVLLLIRQRPAGWEEQVERFVVRSQKNSFYLWNVYDNTVRDYRYSFSNEHARFELRRLAAMALAKHEIGTKHPGVKLIERAAKAIDKNTEPNDAKDGQAG